MESEPTLINRVEASGIVSFDPAELFDQATVMSFDLKDNLYQGMILREKDYREFLKGHNWAQYSGCQVAVYCSVDAILPTWAYMLAGSFLQPFARRIGFGSPDELLKMSYHDALKALDLERFRDKRVVVKGCGTIPVPDSVYLEVSVLLKPVVKSLMFGEPCSTVPVFKNP